MKPDPKARAPDQTSISFSLSCALRARIEEAAKADGRTRSGFIRHILHQHLYPSPTTYHEPPLRISKAAEPPIHQAPPPIPERNHNH